MEAKKLDEIEDELQTAKGASRKYIEIPNGTGVYVIIRGIGAYYRGQKKNFQTGEYIEEEIRNIGLVVLDPDNPDPKDEMTFSVAADTVMASNIVNTFGNGSIENPEINMDFLNHKVFIGKKVVDKGDKSYPTLVWADYGLVDGLPDEPATIGTRGDSVVEMDDIVDDVEV